MLWEMFLDKQAVCLKGHLSSLSSAERHQQACSIMSRIPKGL